VMILATLNGITEVFGINGKLNEFIENKIKSTKHIFDTIWI